MLDGTYRIRSILYYITLFGALFCFFIGVFSCVSTGQTGDSAAAETATQAETQTESDVPVSLDDTQDVGKSGNKKTSGNAAKKLTVVYEETAEQSKPHPDFLSEYQNFCKDFHLHTVKKPAATKNGTPFASDFSVKITDTAGNPVNNLGITVKYPSQSVNGVPVFASEDIVSSAEGIAAFTSPVPEFSCLSEILFYVKPEKTDEHVLQYAEEHALRLPYHVYTDKTGKNFSVSVLDYNQSGKPITSNSLSSSALLKALYGRGFRKAGNSDFVQEIHSGNIPLLHKNAAALFKGAIDYLIFGTIKYEKPVEKTEAGVYTVTLHTEIAIMDIKTGNIVLQTAQSFTSEDKSEWQLLDNMRNKIIAPTITEYMYYNF